MVTRVELRHLRYFLAVAEEGSFTRAAERLHLAQPSLSQQIRVLEREIGSTVFRRAKGSRGVTLTPMGEAFAEDARSILAHVDHSLENLTRRASAAPPLVQLGIPVGLSTTFLSHLVDRITTRVTSVQLELVSASTAEQLRALDLGELDLGLVRLPCSGHDVRLVPVLDQPMGLLLPPDHPLTRRRRVRLADLHRIDVGTFDRTAAPGLYDAISERCRAAGVDPVWRPIVVTETALQARIRIRGIPHLSVRDLPMPITELAWRRIDGDPIHMVTALAWRAVPPAHIQACVAAATAGETPAEQNI